MASKRRIEKLNNLLREEIAKAVDRELEFPDGYLVTITRVRASDNLYHAAVFFSVLAGDAEKALVILQKNVYNIQQQINRKLRMRPVPKIRFVIDKGEKNREEIEQKIAELKRKGEL
ncbi:MAG: ribosome-binding factor A [Deltaproteobacteria bacterium RIFCSPLOWO2_02_FULL_44_10]|nr:MAG: ribosome-binding factor A [Deltaproteobacteria bacterium RIFCSPLOWO2_02_FULL_44_10]